MKSPLLLSLWLPAVVTGAPVITNPGFESNLSGWSSSGVAISSTKVYAGSKCLSLRGGWVSQTITGLEEGARYTFSLSYRDTTPESWILSHARVLVDGEAIGELHNGQDHEYLQGGNFSFISTGTEASLRIESLTGGSVGFLMDELKIVAGGPPAAPEHAWASLANGGGSRGGKRLVNGGFESETSNPSTDPHNSGPADNPHLWGYSLPGWLVTRENVDLIQNDGANAPEGTKVVDVGGHGPGGISQTITGLVPGAVYTFSFLYARHASWEEDDMTGEVLANGRHAESLVRTIDQTWDNPYALKEIPMLADGAGKLTIEIRSTTADQGGNIVYDDLRLKEGGDGFLAWARHHEVESDPHDDADGDGMEQGLEFLLGKNPAVRDQVPSPVMESGKMRLRVPLSGLALAEGFSHQLWCSRNLTSWAAAGSVNSGCLLVSDSSAPSASGERVYEAGAAETKLFWRHGAVSP